MPVIRIRDMKDSVTGCGQVGSERRADPCLSADRTLAFSCYQELAAEKVLHHEGCGPALTVRWIALVPSHKAFGVQTGGVGSP